MAITRWEGSVDGGFTDNANWSNNASVDDGESIIPASATVPIDTDLDASGVKVDLFLTEKGCPIDIGTSGTGISIAADKVVHRGTGTLYYTAAQSASEVTDLIVLDSDNGTNALVLKDDGTSSTTRLVNIGGYATCSSAATNGLTILDNHATDATTVVENGFGTVADLFVSSGKVTVKTTATRIHCTGGVVYVENGGVGATCYVSGTGQLYYNSGTSGTIKIYVTGNGFVDFSGNIYGTTIDTLHAVGPGAKVNEGDGQMTFTNKSILAGASVTSTTGGSVGL